MSPSAVSATHGTEITYCLRISNQESSYPTGRGDLKSPIGEINDAHSGVVQLLAEDLNLEPSGSGFITYTRQIWIDLTR